MRLERHGSMFTLPASEKQRLKDFASATERTKRQTLIDALDREYAGHGQPPIIDDD